MTDEKIMPCPFCGSDVTLADFTGRGDIYLACGCGYRSAVKETEAEAIAAHNRVAVQLVGIKASERLCGECARCREDAETGMKYCELNGTLTASNNFACVYFKAKEANNG